MGVLELRAGETELASEDTTRDLGRGDSLEQKVLSMLGEMKASILGEINERFVSLEAKSYDTKPIWENALIAISEMRNEFSEMRNEFRARFDHLESRLDDVEGKIDVLNRDALQVRSDQARLERRLRNLEEPHRAA